MAKTKAQTKAHLSAVSGDGSIHDRLSTYLDTIEESWFNFSVDAATVYDDDLFKEKGCEKFADDKHPEVSYIHKFLPGLSARVALWRVQIGQAIKKFGLTSDQCSGMGWSKFKELASLMLRDGVTEKQVGEWIEYAQNHTFKEVAEYVKRKKTQRGGEDKEIVTISHRYTDEQAKVIEKAEEMAMTMLELDPAKPNSKNRASEFIHLHFLQYNDPKQVEGLKKHLSAVPEPVATPRKQYAQKGKNAKPKAEKVEKKAPAKAAAKKGGSKKAAKKS